MRNDEPLDDQYDLTQPLKSGGTAVPLGAPPDDEYPVAHLCLPDPSARGGWYVRDVKRRQGSPEPRSMGFRR